MQKQVARATGQNMVNGGKGTYSVVKRVRGTKNLAKSQDLGKRGQFGNREQKRYDLRKALGAKF